MGLRGYAFVFLFSISFFRAEGMAVRKKCLIALAETPTAEAVLASAEIKDEVKEALKAYLALKEGDLVKEWFPEALVLQALANPTFPVYGRTLGAILKTLPKGRRAGEVSLEKAIRKALENRVPASSVETRIAELKKQKPEAVLRALGDNSVEEMKELLVGDTEGAPGANSLVGQYLKETGASFRLRSFPLTETGKREGPARLEVALSQATFDAFIKYFGKEELLSVVGHALLIHNGAVVGIRYDALRLPHVGLALPIVVLKTTEGQRATQFFELFQKLGNGWHHVAALPWQLAGYCAQGGYECCTHWIGNMPLGDKQVDSYTFPGRWEANREKPRTQKLKAYQHDDPLVHRVWRVPGQEQFADMLGQKRANLNGDFATSSAIVNTLLGPTSLLRVPVVFRVVADHKAAIPDEYQVAQ